METMFINRIKKNFTFLKKWAKKEKTNAFRIYDRDIPQYPYIVDYYNEYIVVYKYETPKNQQEFLASDNEKLQNCLNDLMTYFDIDSKKLYLKSRKKQKGLAQYEKENQEQITHIVSEGDMNFIVNVSDYLDCGLFLDHRKTRQIIKSIAKNKSVLNLFAYTGSVSVAAAMGGANNVTTVDMSNTYLEWAKENFSLNKIPLNKHKFIRSDVLIWLNDLQENEKYDLIFIDPPSFSNSKKMLDTFDVQRDYIFLIKQCEKLLQPNGIIVFSNNLKSFKFDENLFNKDFKIKDITKKTIPQDFRNEKIHQAWILEKT